MDCSRCGSPTGWCNCPQKSWRDKLAEIQYGTKYEDPFNIKDERDGITPHQREAYNQGNKKPTTREGWATSYYELPEDAVELGDLIEYRNMNFNVGNIFKACYRLGHKDGTSIVYDLNKIIYFAERELARIKKEI